MRRPNKKVGFRQIHLDFHTSQLIDNIGAEFDPKEFAQTLVDGRVDSINLFIRCHHGNLYYDSKLFPEYVHPNLTKEARDLFRLQANACRERGIHVNAYTTVRWDLTCATRHPDWLCFDQNGKISNWRPYLEAGFYANLCLNTGYRQFLKTQLKEVLDTVEVDGVWFDAANIVTCYCPKCIEGMKAQGLNPLNPEEARKFAVDTYYEFVNEFSDFVHSYNLDYHVTYNKGHVGWLDRPIQEKHDYYAFESLPGGDWGYMDFPLAIRYNRNFMADCAGMTGRFHTTWGDFHSFRNQAALEYECFSMIALAGKCNIGDQLEPGAKLSKDMYKIIGNVYGEIEKKEPWCEDARPVSEIGVFAAEEFFGADVGNLPPSSEGVCRMLTESGFQFDFIDSLCEFTKYKLLVLPDVIPVNKELAMKLEQYIATGGKIFASFESGLLPDKSDFFSPAFGVSYQGNAPFSHDFIKPEGEIGEGLPCAEHVMYLRGTHVEANVGADILQKAIEPVFERSWEHFCSHLHSPSSGKESYPAIVKNNGVIYFIHPVFTQYYENAPLWCKIMVRNAIDMLLGERLLRHNGPSTLVTTINSQEEKKRWIVHLLHYIPERRCKVMDIIEDVIPLYEVNVALNIGKKVNQVICVPQGIKIDFAQANAKVSFSVPKIMGHQMISVEFE